MKKLTICATILAISILHYCTPMMYHHFHAVYQRLYYLPIIAAAYWFGLRWGLASALLSGILYIPHIFFQWGTHMPHETFTQYIEIAMFGVVGSLVGVFSDIQHAQQRKIIEAADQIRRMDRLSLLGQLSAGLAHEIRNPLGSLIGSAEILRSSLDPLHEKFEFVGIMHKELLRLRDKLNQFLRFARPAQPEIVPNSINDVMQETVTLIRKQAKQSNITIEIRLDTKIPLIPMDSEQLKQVLLNLLLNSIQAMPDGGSVAASTWKTSAGFAFAVEDTGKGLTEEETKRIFEPFYTTKQDGTGLGLAIVKQLIEGMGGSVCASVPNNGVGARFEVRVPDEK